MTIAYMLMSIVMACAIPIIIGYYVYKDAKQRRMDAVLWTLVAVLVPGFIGLIIYLIVREDNGDIICPECNQDIANNYVLCPHCGNLLKASCKNCNTVIEPSWKLCPQCGTEIKEEDFAQVKIPKHKQDKGIKPLILILIVIPLCFLVFVGIGLSSFTIIGPQSGLITQSHHVNANSDELIPDVKNWISDCNALGEGVYVLQLSPEKILATSAHRNLIAEEGQNDTYILYVYVNNFWKNDAITSLTSDVNIKAKTLEINFTSSYEQEEELITSYELTEIFITNDQAIETIRVFIDGEEVDCVFNELD